jgi:tetratricopeptide (TPR) repeat protein
MVNEAVIRPQASIDSIGIIAENPLRMVVWQCLSVLIVEMRGYRRLQEGFMPSPFARVFGCLVLVCAIAPMASAQGVAKTASDADAGCANAPTPTGAAAETLAAALQSYRTGQFDAAIAAYNSAIAGGDKAAAPYAYAGLSRVYMKQHNVSEAYDAANKANTLTPNAAPAIVALGEVYFRQGKFTDAETAFRAPCTADARAYLGLARIYEATSNYKSARSSINAAHSLGPDDPDIQRVWVATLSGADRLKYLKAYLGAQSNDDAAHRQNLEHELVVLEDEASASNHSCRLVTKVSSTQVKFDPVGMDMESRISGYGLPVKLNGATANLQLDTGASGILVDRKMAGKAGIKPITREEVHGIGEGPGTRGYIGIADSIKIGDLEFQGCYVDVVDRKSALEDDGLIGADVFEDFLVDLDFPDVKFKLSPLPPVPNQPVTETALQSESSSVAGLHDRYVPPEMKAYSQVFRIGHALLIPTSVNETPYRLFLIDTGSFDDTISPATAKQFTHVTGDSDMRIKGLSGEVSKVYTADQVVLHFGRLKQDRHDLITFDITNTSNGFGTEISGIFGFGMLRMLDMKIDYRDGLVDLVYDPHRFH